MPGIGFHLFDPAFVGMRRGISDPSDLPDLHIWLDAAYGPLDGSDAAISVDGTACKTWTDLQGNLTLTQGTGGSQPVWKANVKNGKPVLRFTGSKYIGNNAAGDFTKPCTMFIVTKLNTMASLVAFAAGESGKRWGFGVWDQPVYGRSFISWEIGGTDVTMGYGSSDWVILTRVYHNSAAKISVNTATMTNVGNVGTAALRGLWLGAYSTGFNPADCDIAEYIHYSSALSDSDCANVINYLSTKYAITLNGGNGWGTIGSDTFESYNADDAVDGLSGGTGFNGNWEGH